MRLAVAALACFAASAAALRPTPASALRAPFGRIHRSSQIFAQLPPGWISGVDPASGQTYYYNEQTGQSQWEPPAGFGGQQGYGAQQGYGGQQALCVNAVSGVTGFHTLQPGQQQVLGRYDMMQQHEGVSRKQCLVEVNVDGTAYLVSKGKPPTGLRRNGVWYWLDTDERQRLMDGDQVSLDQYNPEYALYSCQLQGGMGSNVQGGYGF